MINQTTPITIAKGGTIKSNINHNINAIHKLYNYIVYKSNKSVENFR